MAEMLAATPTIPFTSSTWPISTPLMLAGCHRPPYLPPRQGGNRLLGMSLGFRFAASAAGELSTAAPLALKNRYFNPLIAEQKNPAG
jgi:hypothetical protein